MSLEIYYKRIAEGKAAKANRPAPEPRRALVDATEIESLRRQREAADARRMLDIATFAGVICSASEHLSEVGQQVFSRHGVRTLFHPVWGTYRPVLEGWIAHSEEDVAHRWRTGFDGTDTRPQPRKSVVVGRDGGAYLVHHQADVTAHDGSVPMTYDQAPFDGRTNLFANAAWGVDLLTRHDVSVNGAFAGMENKLIQIAVDYNIPMPTSRADRPN